MTLVPGDSALALASLNDHVLRARAIQFATHYEADNLALLTRAYMLHGSRQAASTSPRTLKAYDTGVRVYVRWAQDGGANILKVTGREAGRFVAFLQVGSDTQGPLSPNSVGLRLSAVRALYRALSWAGAESNAAFAALQVRGEVTPGVVINPPYGEELEGVLAVLPERERLLLLLCSHAGLRISEALAVRRADVMVMPGGRARLQVVGKGGKRRVVPLGRRVREAALSQSPLPGGALFEWNYDQAVYRLRKGFRAAGVGAAWRGFHAARKASATRLYGLSKDFTRVSVFLGHGSVDVTRRYVALPEGDVSDLLEDF